MKNNSGPLPLVFQQCIQNVTYTKGTKGRIQITIRKQ